MPCIQKSRVPESKLAWIRNKKGDVLSNYISPKWLSLIVQRIRRAMVWMLKGEESGVIREGWEGGGVRGARVTTTCAAAEYLQRVYKR